MFLQANPIQTFGIDVSLPLSKNGNTRINPAVLREIWLHQLLNKQQEWDKEEVRRHPLTNEFQTRKFFAN